MTVQSDLDKAYQKKVVGLTEAVTRKTAFDIDAELVQQTPVDTGRARSNWLPSINTPINGRVESLHQFTPNEPITTLEKDNILSVISGYKIDETIYIANNLPYIQRLNNGWSGQNTTPSWVEATVAKYRNQMKKAIKAISNGL